jgi:hypothetical protein
MSMPFILVAWTSLCALHLDIIARSNTAACTMLYIMVGAKYTSSSILQLIGAIVIGTMLESLM